MLCQQDRSRRTAFPGCRDSLERLSYRHRGALLVVALVCLVVVVTIGASLVRQLLLQHRQSLQEQSQLQSLWLAESAVERALARLAEQPDYTGETWQIDGPQLPNDSPGVVVIRVETTAGEAAARRIVVEARYPHDTLYQVVQQRTYTVPSSVSGVKP
jgi:Tfp pilus assembly protein PilX